MNGQFVIENKDGQVVRIVRGDSDRIVVIRRHDTRRIECYGSESELADVDFEFTTLANVTAKSAERSPVDLGVVGQLKFVERIQTVRQNVQIEPESNEEFKGILKKTALGHLLLLVLILSVGYIIKSTKEAEEVVVQVFKQTQPPVVVQPKKPAPTVKVAKKKPKKRKVVKAAKKTVKKQARVKTTNKPVKKSVAVNKMGALGVLGQLNKSSNNAGGFRANTNQRRSGSSGASSSRGNVARKTFGKALIASTQTGESKGVGAGSYGTRGSGGGKSGYGTVSLVGSSSNYFQPLTNEAEVFGGLGMDQINEVIQRNRGQITYCYEKGLQVKPSLKGRVAVHFIINGKGKVSLAKVKRTSLRSSKVENCILARLKSWKFPEPVQNVNVKVNYPFLLSRTGS